MNESTDTATTDTDTCTFCNGSLVASHAWCAARGREPADYCRDDYGCQVQGAMRGQHPLLYAAMTDAEKRSGMIWQTGGWCMVAGATDGRAALTARLTS
jgi:hypothetical protein